MKGTCNTTRTRPFQHKHSTLYRKSNENSCRNATILTSSNNGLSLRSRHYGIEEDFYGNGDWNQQTIAICLMNGVQSCLSTSGFDIGPCVVNHYSHYFKVLRTYVRFLNARAFMKFRKCRRTSLTYLSCKAILRTYGLHVSSYWSTHVS